VEQVVLNIDPVLMSRLKIVYAFQKNSYNVDLKPTFEKWILEELALVIGNEELRIANQSFYAQRSVADEVINRPQIIRQPYVEPIEALLENESEFSDDLAIALGVLDYKKKNQHIWWDCCLCSHCGDEEEDDDGDKLRCNCHSCCVCWCEESHYYTNSYTKDGVKYKYKGVKPDIGCPGHRECKSVRPLSVSAALRLRKDND